MSVNEESPKINKLKGAIVGCGGGGWPFLEELHKNGRFELVGAADIRPQIRERIENEFPGTKTYDDYKKMFMEQKPDVVCIHTLPNTHHLILKEALKHNPKGFLSEKPLGHNVEHGMQIVSSVKKKHIPLQVPHGFVMRAVGTEVLRRVWNGEIGKLRIVEIQNKNWDFSSAGTHWFHFFVTLIKDDVIDWVMAATESSTRTYRDGMRVETTGVSYVQTKSGVRLILQTGDDTLVNSDFEELSYTIIGAEGQIEWSPSAYCIQNKEFPLRTLIKPEPTVNKTHYLNILADEIENRKPDYSNMDASLIALQLVEASYLASKFQRKIYFPWDKRKISKLSHDKKFWPGIPYSGQGGGRNGKVTD